VNRRPLPIHEPVDPAARELLARRAARLRQLPEREEPEQLIALAEFSAGEETFAVEMTRLQAVLPLKRVTPVPLAPPQVIGIVQLPVGMVPVLSFASLTRCGWKRDPEVLLVVRSGKRWVGLDLEEVPRERLVPQRVIAQGRPRPEDGHLELLIDGTKRVLLDLDRLLDPVEAVLDD
jgi:purine-binding chemotaxis protein CheW